MDIKFLVKTYTDKCLLLPREEFSWRRRTKTFQFRLGFLLWDLRLSIDF